MERTNAFYIDPVEDDLAGVVHDHLPRYSLPLTHRAWVVGNGPSLTPHCLQALHEAGEFCIGMNRIHLMYDKTDWRPNVYCMGDVKGNLWWSQDLLFHVQQGYQCFVKGDMLTGLTPWLGHGLGSWCDQHWMGNVVAIPECRHDFMDLRPPGRWHPPYICCFEGSMNVALQVAVLGRNKSVVLIGVDHHWEIRNQKGTPDPNHFDARYDGGMEPYIDTKHVKAEPFNVISPLVIERRKTEGVFVHRLAAREAHARGAVIVNASTFTELETHPRVSFEEALWQ